MADFSMLDNERAVFSCTPTDKGNNPIPFPAGASVAYTTDNPSILQLSFDPPAVPEGSDPLPQLPADGSQGIYVGSGGIGTANITATPSGFPPNVQPETKSVEIKGTEANKLNATFGTAVPEA